MGARAVAVLSALVLPEAITGKELTELGRGQARAAKSVGAVVVGGNIARGRDMSLTTTVIGSAEQALSRRGARAGDELWLVGEVGLAAAGLRLLQENRAGSRMAGASRCLKAWRCPEALVKQGLSLVGRASSAIDVSDGLAADAVHIARASGRALIIEQSALETCLTADLKGVARRLGLDALSLALHGGEDYALLATGPARRRLRLARRIGRVENGAGVFLEDEHARLTPVAGGFDHFSSSRQRP
jgi:thiamine-monophosphate kinase